MALGDDCLDCDHAHSTHDDGTDTEGACQVLDCGCGAYEWTDDDDEEDDDDDDDTDDEN